MTTVYDRLLEWQTIPGAYENWKTYRDILTEDIIESSGKKGGSLLIMGAGACNDLDLARLAEHFESVTLLDRNEEPMHQGVNRQLTDQKLKDRVEIRTADLLGITDDDYRRFCMILQNEVNFHGGDTSVSALADIALDVMEQQYEDSTDVFGRPEFLFAENTHFDMAVICGVHSQLNNMYAWIWDAYSQALGGTDDRVNRRISEETWRRVAAVHEWLFIHTDKTFFSLENSRIGIPGGVQGAYQGICDLRKRAEKNEIILTEKDSVCWPFDSRQGIFYEMKIYTAEKY